MKDVLPLAVAVVLLAASSVGAAELSLNTTLLGQVRENEDLQKEVPFNGYLGLGLSQPKWNLSGESDMRLFRDLKRNIADYDLYQTVLHAKPFPALRIDFGRQFVNQGFSAEVIDGILTTTTPVRFLEMAVYSGIPRSVERGDFNRNDGLLTGLSLGLKEISGTGARLHAVWRKNDIRFKELKRNDEVLIGADLSHRFRIFSKPFLYGLVEYNPTGRNFDTGTVGIDLTPTRRVALNLEGNYFNVNRDSDRKTILGLFASGPVLSGRLASTWTLLRDRLDLVQGYSLQRTEIQAGLHRLGHLLDVAFPISFDEIGLAAEPAYYFSKSFGGTLQGGRISCHEQVTERLTADLGIDLAKYEKVTGKNDTAFSTVLWTGYEIVKGWTVSAGFEYNRNTLFNKDMRGSFKIEYQFHRGASS